MASDQIKMLRTANFEWAVACRTVWHDSLADVPQIHSAFREEFAAQLQTMAAPTVDNSSPLGSVIVGQGGTGKTHLLGRFRAECARQTASFVLVDMTDVHDFWSTVLLGYFTSLQETLRGSRSQFDGLIAGLLKHLHLRGSIDDAMKYLRTAKADALKATTDRVMEQLSRSAAKQLNAYGDVIRAVIALNSEDFGMSNVGSAWLQGEEIDLDARKMLGLIRAKERSSGIVRALSWLMSLSGPSVVAIDQLDPIVTQLDLERQVTQVTPAVAIINKLGAGLCEFRDAALRTLTVVSCLEQTWQLLSAQTPKQFTDRYRPARFLPPVNSQDQVEFLIASRLQPCFQKAKFIPPYATWPFKKEWVASRTADSPRQILKACSAHLDDCFRHDEVREIPSGWTVTPPPTCADRFAELDAKFAAHQTSFKPATVTDEAQEDKAAADLVRAALRCAVQEITLPDDVDVQIEESFTGAKDSKPLHARLRFIYPKENSREQHACVRVLQKTSARAFSSRLRSAITQAGIDKQLKFRQLVIVRTTPLPGGPATKKLIDEFISLGGVFHAVSDADLATLDALARIEKGKDPCFGEWLKARQPASKTAIVQRLLPKVDAAKIADVPPVIETPKPDKKPQTVETPTPGPMAVEKKESEDPGKGKKPEVPPVIPTPRKSDLLLGHRLISDKPTLQPTLLPVIALKKHGVVFAGAGSGKTVLLKRLIEEAALLGVPSIVIDIANDLAALGDARANPQELTGADAADAARFFEKAECIVWTPGKDSGNPMGLEPLPDLTAVANSPEEFDEAVSMAVESLKPIVAAGGAGANRKEAVLQNALIFLGKNGNCNLQGLAGILNDFPAEATTRIAGERKLAEKMADDLNAALTTNPLLRSSGPVLDPSVLLKSPSGKTRISIISMIGLPTQEQQTHFVNQLAMTLFTWIKKRPGKTDELPIGLLFIDEARDFVPSGKSSACLGSMRRLAAQARKYGLGIVLATQNPKDLDNRIVGQCSTQWYGKQSAPVAIDAVEELIKTRGGQSVNDIGGLKVATFYVSNADHLPQPSKLRTPICFSAHGSALDAEAVTSKAVASRSRV